MSDQDKPKYETNKAPLPQYGPAQKQETDPSLQKPQRKWQHWFEGLEQPSKIQLAGVFVAAIYSGLTFALLWTTKEGIHSGQRAYVVADTFSIDGPLAAGKPISVSVIFKNTGLTPAIGATAKVSLVVDTIEIDGDLVANPIYLSITDIGAGGTRTGMGRNINVVTRRSITGAVGPVPLMTAEAVSTLTAEQVQQIADGRLRFYVYADVYYRDVFDHWWNRDNLTAACAWLSGTEFNGCAAHNRIQ